MQEEFEREKLLIGNQGLEKLHASTVIVYGIGGVGGYVVEGLVRAGIGHIILVDYDVIDITNINRQIHAMHSTIGKRKIDVMMERALDINSELKIEVYDSAVLKQEEELINSSITYVVDAVDTLSSKIKLIEKSKQTNIPIICCMGVGNKINPFKFEISDISKTSVCPLAKALRKELKNRKISNVKVLFSKEEATKENKNSKNISSISYMPAIAGFMISAEVIKDIGIKA